MMKHTDLICGHVEGQLHCAVPAHDKGLRRRCVAMNRSVCSSQQRQVCGQALGHLPQHQWNLQQDCPRPGGSVERKVIASKSTPSMASMSPRGPRQGPGPGPGCCPGQDQGQGQGQGHGQGQGQGRAWAWVWARGQGQGLGQGPGAKGQGPGARDQGPGARATPAPGPRPGG